MNATSDHPNPAGHASTELLSAFLDRRVETDEAAFLERHLAECAACAEELAGLDAVRALLGRLPAIPPPRSFELREPIPLFRVPRVLIWTRAATAVAASFFVVLFSLDLLGFGADVPVPPPSATLRSATGAKASVPAPAAATSAPAAARPANEAAKAASEPKPASAPPAAAPPSATIARPAADSRVESLAATPTTPISPPDPPRSASMTPLRQASIGTGALALVFAAAAFLVGRRRAAR